MEKLYSKWQGSEKPEKKDVKTATQSYSTSSTSIKGRNYAKIQEQNVSLSYESKKAASALFPSIKRNEFDQYISRRVQLIDNKDTSRRLSYLQRLYRDYEQNVLKTADEKPIDGKSNKHTFAKRELAKTKPTVKTPVKVEKPMAKVNKKVESRRLNYLNRLYKTYEANVLEANEKNAKDDKNHKSNTSFNQRPVRNERDLKKEKTKQKPDAKKMDKKMDKKQNRILAEDDDDDDDNEDDEERRLMKQQKSTDSIKFDKEKKSVAAKKAAVADKKKAVTRRAQTSNYYSTPSTTTKVSKKVAAHSKVVKKNIHRLRDPGSDSNYNKMRSDIDGKADKKRRLNYHDFIYKTFPDKKLTKSEKANKKKLEHKEDIKKHHNEKKERVLKYWDSQKNAQKKKSRKLTYYDKLYTMFPDVPAGGKKGVKTKRNLTNKENKKKNNKSKGKNSERKLNYTRFLYETFNDKKKVEAKKTVVNASEDTANTEDKENKKEKKSVVKRRRLTDDNNDNNDENGEESWKDNKDRLVVRRGRSMSRWT